MSARKGSYFFYSVCIFVDKSNLDKLTGAVYQSILPLCFLFFILILIITKLGYNNNYMVTCINFMLTRNGSDWWGGGGGGGQLVFLFTNPT